MRWKKKQTAVAVQTGIVEGLFSALRSADPAFAIEKLARDLLPAYGSNGQSALTISGPTNSDHRNLEELLAQLHLPKIDNALDDDLEQIVRLEWPKPNEDPNCWTRVYAAKKIKDEGRRAEALTFLANHKKFHGWVRLSAAGYLPPNERSIMYIKLAHAPDSEIDVGIRELIPYKFGGKVADKFGASLSDIDSLVELLHSSDPAVAASAATQLAPYLNKEPVLRERAIELVRSRDKNR